MDGRPVLVTGAAGFIGGRLVAALLRRGVPVRAGVRDPARAAALTAAGAEVVRLELTDAASVRAAVAGAGTLHHLAGLTDGRTSAARLREVNAAGTRRLWEAAAAAGVERAVCCSTTAVYGLAAARDGPIDEAAVPRAVEPYGRSKLAGERAARAVAAATGLATVVLRPAAVFGAGEGTPVGRVLRRIAVSRVVLPGADGDWAFSYVHVDDVVEAALHVAGRPRCAGGVYNVAIEPPLRFGEAFAAYRRALRRCGRRRWRERTLAAVSAAVQPRAACSRRLPARLRRPWLHDLWRPGWDLTFTSARLRATGFAFAHADFTEVLDECLRDR